MASAGPALPPFLAGQYVNLFAELAGPHLHRTTYYLCGPPPLYDFCIEVLSKLDVARRRVRYEANGPPAQPERVHDWPGQLDPATTFAVSVKGQDKFVAPCGEPLLNSLERAGYQLEVGLPIRTLQPVPGADPLRHRRQRARSPYPALRRMERPHPRLHRVPGLRHRGPTVTIDQVRSTIQAVMTT